MCVVRCVLSVVWSSLVVVGCRLLCGMYSLFGVRCLLCVVCWLLFVLCCSLFAFCCLLYAVCCTLLAVRCLRFVACVLCVVCCLMVVVCCLSAGCVVGVLARWCVCC